MKMIPQNARDVAARTGLSSLEVDSLLRRYGNDVAIVRASEICQVKAHYHNKPTPEAEEERIRNLAGSDMPLASPSHLRMHLGNVIEDYLVENLLKEHYQWRHQQMPLEYYYEDFHVVMVGHIDGLTGENPTHLGEIKSTSNAHFEEVCAANDFPDELDSTMLDKYRTQMRVYAAMAFLAKGTDDRLHGFVPCYGTLVVTNRDNCDTAIMNVNLFEEDEDVERWLKDRILESVGYQHPLTGVLPPKPDWARPTHPICQTCTYNEDCWDPDGEIERVDDSSGLVHAELYDEGSRLVKLGEIYKKTAKDHLNLLFDRHGQDRLQLSDSVKVSRHTYNGRRKVDTQRLKQDGIWEEYTIQGNPYNVMRVDVKR